MYEGKQVSFTKFCKYLSHVNLEGVLASAMNARHGSIPQSVQDDSEETLTHRCFVDGSWTEQWQGGIGILLQKEHSLVL